MGFIHIGKISGVREDENDESKNWGMHGNLDLHGWAFDRFTKTLIYKSKIEGIEVVEVSTRDTSKTWCASGREDDCQRVERGLYVCKACDAAVNAGGGIDIGRYRTTMHCLILVQADLFPDVSLGFREDVSEADWLHLTEGEEVRWSGRPSQYTLLPATLVMVLLVVLGVLLTALWQPFVVEQGWPWIVGYLPLLVSSAGLAYAAWIYLQWRRLLYVITDEEVYVKLGLVSRDVTQVPLTRVQNTSYNQTVVQRLLSYGNIYIYSAGTHTDDLLLRNVPNPERINGILTAQLSERHAAQSSTDVP